MNYREQLLAINLKPITMQEKITLFTTYVFLFLFSTSLLAQNIDFQWVKQIGGTGSEFVKSITTDVEGNVYTTGSFQDIVDFNPGEDSLNFTSVGFSDIFIQKLDRNGNLIWAKHYGAPGTNLGTGIITDAQGNVYATGQFENTVTFDPGNPTSTLTSFGMADIFLLKLDAAGNFLWVKQMGGTNYDANMAITLDPEGNIYTTGHFSGIADFDPSSGEANLSAIRNNDVFVQKLDNNGNLLWVKQMGGRGFEYGISIKTDAVGNVYTAGYFQNTVDFDPGSGIVNLTSNGKFDVFVQKLDPSGGFLWAKQIGGTGDDRVHQMTIDDNANIYLTGFFEDTVDFDPGSETLNYNSNGLKDIFILKLNTDGEFIWAKQIGGSSNDEGKSIAINSTGGVFISGHFADTVDFNPKGENTIFTTLSPSDIFILQLNADGDFIWAKQFEGPLDDTGVSLTTDGDDILYSTGIFRFTVNFDPGKSDVELSSSGLFDIYILKLGIESLGIIDNDFAKSLHIYPNPTKGKFSVEFNTIQTSMEVRLFTLSGQLLMQKRFQNIKIIPLEIQQPQGIYLLQLKNSQGQKITIKLLKN